MFGIRQISSSVSHRVVALR